MWTVSLWRGNDPNYRYRRFGYARGVVLVALGAAHRRFSLVALIAARPYLGKVFTLSSELGPSQIYMICMLYCLPMSFALIFILIPFRLYRFYNALCLQFFHQLPITQLPPLFPLGRRLDQHIAIHRITRCSIESTALGRISFLLQRWIS
jgi:hypothetical protein